MSEKEYITFREYSRLQRQKGSLDIGASAPGVWGRSGAGILIVSPDLEEVLLLQRAPNVSEPNLWSIPGGERKKVGDHLEDPLVTAVAETREKIGVLPKGRIIRTPYTKRTTDFPYYTFILMIDPKERDVFSPTLNGKQHIDYRWCRRKCMFAENISIHPGLRDLLVNYDFRSIQPSTLYRGYIGEKKQGFQPVLKSKIDIQAAISGDGEFDPERLDLVGKLLWATPQMAYAKGVATCRFVVKMALYPRFRQAVLSQGKFSPAIVVFEPNPQSVYSLDDKHLDPFECLYRRNKVLVQEIDGNHATVLLPTKPSLTALIDYVTTVYDTHIRTLSEATSDINVPDEQGIPLLSWDGFKGMTLLQGLKKAFDSCCSIKKDKPMFVEDRLTEGLYYSYTGHIQTLVKYAG